MPGKTYKDGRITITLEQPLLKEIQIEFTLTLVPSAVERTELAVDKNYKLMFLGDNGSWRAKTGFDNGTNTSGIWYVDDDSYDNGTSYVRWPIDNVDLSDPESVNRLVEYCGGICGTAVIDTCHGENLDYNGFVQIGFDFAGLSSNGESETVDVSSLDGVCISYISQAAPDLNLRLSDELEETIGYSNPYVFLPKGRTALVTKYIAWTDFKQPSWYKSDLKISGIDAASQATGISFKIQAAPGEYFFNIYAVGAYDGNCPSSFEGYLGD